MNGKLITLRPDGTREERDLTDAPDFMELGHIVGGYIEHIAYFNKFEGMDCAAFCNEEGKLPKANRGPLPPNLHAQAAWEKAVGHPIHNDFLVGPIAIVCGDRELMRAL
jgi:hypothetical protein